MLGDTLVLPHSGGDITCDKVKEEGYTSEYRFMGSLSSVIVKVRHTQSKATSTKPAMDRHNVEVVETIYATATEDEYYRKVYFVMESLPSDLDVELMDALADWAIVTANANLDKLMTWQS